MALRQQQFEGLRSVQTAQIATTDGITLLAYRNAIP